MPVTTRSQSAIMQANNAVDRMVIHAARHGFHRDYINHFLNDSLGPSAASVDDISTAAVRPLECLARRDLYGAAEKVTAAFYHPRGFDLGTAPQFRTESNWPLDPAATLILAQVVAVANLNADKELVVSEIHDAWVHAWLACRPHLPNRLLEGVAYIRPYDCVRNRYKLVEPLFIALAYRMIVTQPDAAIEEIAETCMDLSTNMLMREAPELF